MTELPTTTAPPKTTPPPLEFAFTVEFELSAEVVVPVTTTGVGYVSAGITGGHIRGGRISGQVVPGGVTTSTVRADGVVAYEALCFLYTDAGDVLRLKDRGFLAAHDTGVQEVRTAPLFDVEAGELNWVARSGFIGVGHQNGAVRVVDYFRVA